MKRDIETMRGKPESVGASDYGDQTLHQALAESHDRERALAAESQHRIRNLIAITRSIFQRTIETSTSLEAASDHFLGRLDTIARYNGRSEAVTKNAFDLETMVWDALLVFAAAGDPRVAVAGADVDIPQHVAETLGLALHELVANAVKYGVLSQIAGCGSLRIGWEVREEALHFEWRESGVAIIAPAPRIEGFGRSFLENALPYHLDATVIFRLEPGGLMCRIRIPLPRDAGRAHDPDDPEVKN